MSKILIVDDNPQLRRILLLLLSGKYDILEAANGKEAIDLYNQHHPDLIITDFEMPLMNGIELIRNIHAIGGKVKIILTSTLIPRNKLHYVEGADLCLTKPVTLETLESAIANLLDQHRS